MAVQPEHVHLVASLQRTQTVDAVAKPVKGESAHWINEQRLVSGYSSWQRGFWAESIRPRHTHFVIDDINGQKQHHRRRTYLEEYENWLNSQQVSKNEAVRMIREEAAEAAMS